MAASILENQSFSKISSEVWDLMIQQIYRCNELMKLKMSGQPLDKNFNLESVFELSKAWKKEDFGRIKENNAISLVNQKAENQKRVNET
jgi:hypothetical protein